MPTGYTAYILDDEVTTGKDFLKLCTRAFGVAINQRDEPLNVPTNERQEMNNHYRNRMNEAITNLKNIFEMNYDQMTFAMTQEHYEKVKRAKETVRRLEDENIKLIKVKDDVEKWQPPTEEHKGLKKFALEQIDMSMNSDSLVDVYIEDMNKVLDTSKEAVLEWYDEKLEDAMDELNNAYKWYKEEYKRIDSRNQWMKDFLDSLEDEGG